MKTFPARAVAVLWLLLCPVLSAQKAAETPLTAINKPPARNTTRAGKTTVELSTWKITDVRSPYYGLTLMWLEILESEAHVAVEKVDGQAIPAGAPTSDVLAILSGGTWTGRYDSPKSPKRETGLVVSKGTAVSAFTAGLGGVLWFCENDLRILDAVAYASKYAKKLPCKDASVLQTSAIVVRDGKPQSFTTDRDKANRLAIGQDEDRIIIAGAFTPLGTALSLPDFAAWLAAAAKQTGRNDLDAVNLDGGCSAQLFIPPLKQRFGCSTAGYNINRIVVRRKP